MDGCGASFHLLPWAIVSVNRMFLSGTSFLKRFSINPSLFESENIDVLFLNIVFLRNDVVSLSLLVTGELQYGPLGTIFWGPACSKRSSSGPFPGSVGQKRKSTETIFTFRKRCALLCERKIGELLIKMKERRELRGKGQPRKSNVDAGDNSFSQESPSRSGDRIFRKS